MSRRFPDFSEGLKDTVNRYLNNSYKVEQKAHSSYSLGVFFSSTAVSAWPVKCSILKENNSSALHRKVESIVYNAQHKKVEMYKKKSKPYSP